MASDIDDSTEFAGASEVDDKKSRELMGILR
jgi:hypothetical protein